MSSASIPGVSTPPMDEILMRSNWNGFWEGIHHVQWAFKRTSTTKVISPSTHLSDQSAQIGPAILHMGTRLLWASRTGDASVIKGILEQGADPDAVNSMGTTALQWTAHFGHFEALSILLQAGADPNIHDVIGKSAYMLSCNTKVPDWIPGHTNSYGKERLREQLRTGRLECQRILREWHRNSLEAQPVIEIGLKNHLVVRDLMDLCLDFMGPTGIRELGDEEDFALNKRIKHEPLGPIPIPQPNSS